MKRLFLTILILLFCSTVYADSEGPNSPGTMADDAAVGTDQWYNVDNVKISNNNYSITEPGRPLVYSHYLKATNFGFSIPSGATITGILVEIEKYKRSSEPYVDVRDSEVKIVKSDGSIGTTNRADTVSQWPTSEDYVSYGASDDLWGETWTKDDINHANFGAVLSVLSYSSDDDYPTYFVDHIRITVYYTELPSVTILYNAVIENAVIN